MPLDPTAAQSAANRANGALSSGPISEAGKAASAGNAVRHGLAGQRIILDDQEQARLAALRDDYTARLRPIGPLEGAAIATMALAVVKMRRADAMEVLVCDAIVRKDGDAWPTLGTVMRYRARIAREQREASAELTRLQREQRAAAPKSRTNEPDRQSIGRSSAPPESAKPAPPPASVPSHRPNRRGRRRIEALERKRRTG